MAVYTLGINDREAKCYVACMFLKFNVVRLIIFHIMTIYLTLSPLNFLVEDGLGTKFISHRNK